MKIEEVADCYVAGYTEVCLINIDDRLSKFMN